MTMTQKTAPLKFYFNFRSIYCYLSSKRMFDIVDDFHVEMVWRPLGGWDGRSPPERAKAKVPLARQDVARWAAKMGIPFVPPPPTTDPTNAAAGSLLAEREGLLRPYITEVMRAEWAFGRDIGDRQLLKSIGADIGLDPAALESSFDDARNHAALKANWEEAQADGVIGVPSFVIGSEIFWGNDRIDFVTDHLKELRLARL
ncbi:2-hydroxychromene-2-carboxylate isomerase (plasmid) [Sphingobium sp. AntQ-1]|uniref:2-hydroxychromene-2-carboxylate isomerase n=1 Tax=Sphingobium sp. AntQ-1 TaxID=2930091 RepID=UPI00234F174D|nr:DsbA family protein [Sphingobium sp. AntQ-1]WCP15980.1 2-hydroxychromene-2-carboxylate isomerase [Sphingobium sp. AntQ-1]